MTDILLNLPSLPNASQSTQTRFQTAQLSKNQKNRLRERWKKFFDKLQIARERREQCKALLIEGGINDPRNIREENIENLTRALNVYWSIEQINEYTTKEMIDEIAERAMLLQNATGLPSNLTYITLGLKLKAQLKTLDIQFSEDESSAEAIDSEEGAQEGSAGESESEAPAPIAPTPVERTASQDTTDSLPTPPLSPTPASASARIPAPVWRDPDLMADLANRAEQEPIDERFVEFVENESDELIDWEEYEATLDKNITELIIEPKKYRFKDNKLVIKDYSNLKTLWACGLGLKKVELDCSSLEDLYLNDNELKQLELSKIPNLKNLVINGNEITYIDVKKLTKLESLSCNTNSIVQLDVQDLKHLRYLDCSGNFYFVNQRIIDGKFVYDSVIGLQLLKLGNNPNLKVIDAAESHLQDTNFPYLPSLEALSLRENVANKRSTTENGAVRTVIFLILRSPNLELLDYHGSNIKKAIFHPDYPLKNPDKLAIVNAESYTNPDGTYNPDAATTWEQWIYERNCEREEEIQKTSNVPLTHFTATHQHLEEVVINGDLFHNAVEYINLGNNFLKKAVIKNCPHLKFLNVSHNAFTNLEQDIVLENCGQFDRQQIIRGNWNGENIYLRPDASGEARPKWKDSAQKPLQVLILDPADPRYDWKGAPHEVKLYLIRKQITEMVANPDNFTTEQIIAFDPGFWGFFLTKELRNKFGALYQARQQTTNQRTADEMWERIRKGVEEDMQKRQQQPPTPPSPPKPQDQEIIQLVNAIIHNLEEVLAKKDWTKIEELIRKLKNEYWGKANATQQAAIEKLERKIQELKAEQQNASSSNEPTGFGKGTVAATAITMLSLGFIVTYKIGRAKLLKKISRRE